MRRFGLLTLAVILGKLIIFDVQFSDYHRNNNIKILEAYTLFLSIKD